MLTMNFLDDETIQKLRDIFISAKSDAESIIYIFAYGFEYGYESAVSNNKNEVSKHE